MPNAAIWECIYLSQGFDPSASDLNELNLYRDKQGYMQIAKKLDIAVAHVDSYHLKTFERYANEYVTLLSIPVFIAWAKTLNWEVHEQFTGYTPPKIQTVETPKVVPPKTALLAKPEKKINSRERANLIRVVGALLAAINGTDGLTKHQKYDSQTKLVKAILSRFKDFEGISKTNLENVFSEANQAFTA